MHQTLDIWFSSILLLTIFSAVSSAMSWGTWSDGYYANYAIAKYATTTQLCGQFCFQKIIDGELYVGAVLGPTANCYCLIKTLGYTNNQINTYKQVQYSYSLIEADKSICKISERVTFRVRVRFFTEGNDKSMIYFIDNLNEPLKRSGRIYNTDFINLGRSTYDTRTLKRYNETKQYNSLEESYVGGGIDTEVENLYTLVAKIGDMSVANNQTEWALLVVSSDKRLQFTLTPFTIVRPPMNCSLQIATLSNVTKETLYVTLSITTSLNCTSDLKNISIILHPEQKLTPTGLIWDSLSITPTSVIITDKFSSIYVSDLRIDSIIKFFATFDKNITTVVTGSTNLTVLATASFYDYINNKTLKKSTTFMFKRPLQQLKQEITKLNPKPNNITTSFETTNHRFVCQSIQKRQQTPCFQKEKSTGRITFLPMQLLDVVGYSPITNLVYGKTFRDKIVELDFKRKKPVVIISSEKWAKIKNDTNFQYKKT